MRNLIGPRKHRPARRGMAIVEMAIVLPVIVLLFMGTVEVCGKIYLQQSLTIAAYEGALVAARADGTNATSRTRIEAILDSRGISGHEVTFSVNNVSAVAPGDNIQVTVTAPVSVNGLFPSQMYPISDLSATLTFVKEDSP